MSFIYTIVKITKVGVLMFWTVWKSTGQLHGNTWLRNSATSFPGLFPLKLGGAGKDPGIGWSRDPKHPKILGVINYDMTNV